MSEALTWIQVEELALKIANGKVVGYLNRLVDSHESLRTQLTTQTERAEKASVEFALFRFKIADLTAKLAQVEQEKADMVLRNRLLRDRPDLPIERLETYKIIENRITERDARIKELGGSQCKDLIGDEHGENECGRVRDVERRLDKAQMAAETLQQQLARVREELEAASDALHKCRYACVGPAVPHECVESVTNTVEQALRELDTANVKESLTVDTWTTDKPTVPGWYWFRSDNVTHYRYLDNYHVTIVKQCVVFLNPSTSMLDGEWQGPITPKENR